MLYLYHKEAGQSQLTLLGDEHRYIFKVRRHKVDDTLYLRNLEDGLLYRYRIAYIDKRSAKQNTLCILVGVSLTLKILKKYCLL